MVKVELHTHTADDPQDLIPHSAHDLIDRAATLEYGAVAITLHNRQLDPAPLRPYARERGIVLIPGAELTVRGKHVLVINSRAPVDHVRTFDDLLELKSRGGGLVVAPHPFFPLPSCLQGVLDEYPALFDAIEVSGFYTAAIDFNGRARRWAAAHDKPMVGNGDVHRLAQLGQTYSLVDSEADPNAICDAVRRGAVEVRTRPLSWVECARIGGSMMLSDVRRVARLGGSPPTPEPSVAPGSGRSRTRSEPR